MTEELVNNEMQTSDLDNNKLQAKYMGERIKELEIQRMHNLAEIKYLQESHVRVVLMMCETDKKNRELEEQLKEANEMIKSRKPFEAEYDYFEKWGVE